MQGLEWRDMIGDEGRHVVEIWEIYANLATLAKMFCIRVDTAW
jgi:hypothetical protein